MSQTADVKPEPRKWPIAPDGYIPNSVIRSWGVKDQVPHPSEGWEEVICYSIHGEEATHDKEDLSSRVFWFDEDSEEDEQKKTDGAKRRRKEHRYETEDEADLRTKAEKWKEKDDEKHPRREVEREKERGVEGNKGVNEKNEEKMDPTDFPKQPFSFQTTSHHEDKMKHLPSTFHPKPGRKAPTELREDITPARLSVSSKHIPAELPQPGVNFPVASANTLSPNGGYCRQELSITDYIKPTEHHDRTFLTTRVVAVPRTGQGNTDRLRVNSDPCSSPALTSMLSSIHAQHHRVIHPKHAEWRRSLHTLISLQGFRCKRAVRLAAAEHPVAPSTARRLTAPIPSVGPDQVSAHQRVVKKIQVKDALELTSTCFRHVIPMPAQHSVFTLGPCGTTQYGRLQFDWMRGHEEGELLKVCVAKPRTDSESSRCQQSFFFNTPA